MVQYWNTGKPFSITYITWDWQTGRGGAIKSYQQAVKHYGAESKGNESLVNNKGALVYATKNPGHFHNGTTNIRVTAAGNAEIRKIHIQLVRRFNGCIVK